MYMQMLNFEQLAENKRFYHIIIKFRKFGNLQLKTLFEGCDDLYNEINAIYEFSDDANVFDFSEKVVKDMELLPHKFKQNDLNTILLIFYFAAVVAKRLGEQSFPILNEIDNLITLDAITEFVNLYKTGLREKVISDNENSMNGKKSCYAELFAQLTQLLDGRENEGWDLESLPVIDSTDILFLPEFISYIDTYYNCMFLPVVASNDEAFAMKVKSSKI